FFSRGTIVENPEGLYGRYRPKREQKKDPGTSLVRCPGIFFDHSSGVFSSGGGSPMGPPIAAIGAFSFSPEPSRRPRVTLSVIGLPLAAAARSGVGAAHAWIRTSSPLRKRCERTPPVARPLDGKSAKSA